MTSTVSPTAHPDGRHARGDRTRKAILEAAARLASREGLEGLSIGRLASHLGISKSGLYAHFESKEELQLAAIRTAAKMYERDVVGPALEAEPGLERLLAFTATFFDYVERGPFPGGCFFIASQLDPAIMRSRVKALLAEEQRALLGFMAECIREAQVRGELDGDRLAEQVAFEVDSLMAGADINFILFDDPAYLARGQEAVRRLLKAG